MYATNKRVETPQTKESKMGWIEKKKSHKCKLPKLQHAKYRVAEGSLWQCEWVRERLNLEDFICGEAWTLIDTYEDEYGQLVATWRNTKDEVRIESEKVK